MNWSRAKTILIIMFLLTDAFLLVVLLQTRQSLSQIPAETIEQTADILLSRGVQVQKEQIPADRAENRTILMENYFLEPERVAVKMLGREVTAVTLNQEAYEYSYQSPRGTLQIQDSGFTYTSSKTPKPYRSEALPAYETAAERLSEYLEALGFDKNTAALVDVRIENGLCSCLAVPLYQNAKIYGISMHITADSEEILSIEGNWFTAVGSESYEESQLLDITAVLVELAYRDDCSPMEIAAISHGYWASDDYLSSREVVAVPVYAITDTKGIERIFDAQLGSLIE